MGSPLQDWVKAPIVPWCDKDKLGFENKDIFTFAVQGSYKTAITEKTEFQLGVGLEFLNFNFLFSFSIQHHITPHFCSEFGLDMKCGFGGDLSYCYHTDSSRTYTNYLNLAEGSVVPFIAPYYRY